MSKISNVLYTFGESSNIGDPHWCASHPGFKDKYDTLNESDKEDFDVFAKSVKAKVDNFIDKNKSIGMANFDKLKRLSDEIINKSTKHGEEVVKSPNHYHSRVSDEKMKYIIDRINRRGYIEVIDIIDAWNLDFPIGSAVKYELRLGEKDDELTEIDKAIEYLNFKKEMLIADRKNKHNEN